MRGIVTICLMAVLGGSAPALADDFSRCLPSLQGGTAQGAYGLGADERMLRPRNDPSLVSYADDGKMETAVLKLSGTKLTVVNQSKDGRPVSFQTTVGDKGTMVASFSYQGDKCYVSEMAYKSTDPKTKKASDVVVYSKDLCDGVLAAAGTFDQEALNKCAAAFGTIESLRNNFTAKLAAGGRSLVDYGPLMRMGIPNAAPLTTAPPSSLDLLASCRLQQALYPVNGIGAGAAAVVRSLPAHPSPTAKFTNPLAKPLGGTTAK